MGSSEDRIVKKYYDHKDTIMVNRLSEIVSDLYLAGTGDKAARLWERAASALVKTQVAFLFFLSVAFVTTVI